VNGRTIALVSTLADIRTPPSAHPGNVDQYYEEEVQYIYSSVVEALTKDATRRFIFVETAFFMRWWRDQDAATKATTKGLIDNGQIEFVNGGW
jgi:lysosomal alpha-mannosidase